jgi:hypothetical protein
VVDYIRSLGGARVRDLVITPYEHVLSIGAVDSAKSSEEETLFLMPRTDSFLKALVRTAAVADRAIKNTLQEMERLSRRT